MVPNKRLTTIVFDLHYGELGFSNNVNLAEAVPQIIDFKQLPNLPRRPSNLNKTY